MQSVRPNYLHNLLLFLGSPSVRGTEKSGY
jgi:hypothetical protein